MTEKNNRKRNKVKAVILAAALSVSMMFAVTACGPSTDTAIQQETSTQQESSMPDTTIAATQSSTTVADDASSEIADGTYTGTITSVSDTSITVSVMGAGMQGGPGDGSDMGSSGQTFGAGKPSDKAPDGGSGMQSGGDGKGGPKDGAGQGESGMQPANGSSMEAPQGQEMTFTVTADQVSGFVSGDMVTVTVANGTVSSVEKAQAPEPAANASNSSDSE